jgi:S-adenosylmethionine:tRNA-ribosyltransferase-isomerase (queuine synthetase)
MWPKRTKKIPPVVEKPNVSLTHEEFEKLLNSFDYQLPPELIANEPATPRDTSRLLIYNRMEETTHIDSFSNITNYLPERAVIVFNQTKVIPAKFTLTKKTGGKVRALFLQMIGDGALSLQVKFSPGKTVSHSLSASAITKKSCWCHPFR